jgi:hypothetical protein
MRSLAGLCINNEARIDWLWYGEPNAIGSAEFYSCSANAVFTFMNALANLIETHKHAVDFKEP